MPSLLNKKRLDEVTEFEKPGRVAAHSTITVSDILESRKAIPVLSGLHNLGNISVTCSFLDKQEINLLEGQKEMQFCSLPTQTSSMSSGHLLNSLKATQTARTYQTADVPRESDYEL